MQSFYPCTKKLRELHSNINQNQNQNLSSLPPAFSIIKLAAQSPPKSNTFEQLSALLQGLEQDQNKDEYFNLNTQDTQTMVNQLNVQCTLSKKQLNQLHANGYDKLKVCLVR